MEDEETEDEEMKLLKRAFKTLGFRLAKRGRCLRIVDSEGREYKRCLENSKSLDGILGVSSVDELLETEMFEHWRFVPFDPLAKRLKIVPNPFWKMSREQLEIRLALEGKA